MNRTPEQWLALDDELGELGVKVAEVLTPRHEWKHDLQQGFFGEAGTLDLTWRCKKCEQPIDEYTTEYAQGVPGGVIYVSDDPCRVPTPIGTEEWKVAMEWRDKMCADDIVAYMKELRAVCKLDGIDSAYMACVIKPKHYLIAVVTMAAKKENQNEKG